MLTCVLLLLGCGSDSVVSLGQGGPARNILGRSPERGQGGAGGALDAGIDGGVSTGACDNPEDLTAIAMTNMNAVMTSCTGLVCLNTLGDPPRYEQCVDTCVESNASTISSECVDCYGRVARCGLEAFCLGVCQFNTCGLQCLNCLDFVGCLAEFEGCRGIPGSDCNGGGHPFIPATDNQ